MLPLIIAPHERLRTPAAPIPLPVDEDVAKLARDMFLAMVHYRGIGLAAPQVGHSLRLMVIATPGAPTAYLNPQIVKRSLTKTDMEEGCLSLPGLFGIVRRPARIYVRHHDLVGTAHETWLEGLIARVYQHEVDHLNGVLFIDKTKRLTQGQELLKTYGAR